MRVSHTIGRAVVPVLLAATLAAVSVCPSEAEESVTALPVQSSYGLTGYPVGDCATLLGTATAGVLALEAAGLGGVAASAASLASGTSAAAFHGAMIGVALGAREGGKNCIQYNGNASSRAICSASNFSAWDPRGIAARAVVRLATWGAYTRC